MYFHNPIITMHNEEKFLNFYIGFQGIFQTFIQM